MTLTIGSLFSGIGGLERGLELAGLGPVVWQVERDPFCREVLAKHWPEARRFTDVRSVGSSNLAAVDVVCGGFPCQDVSLAGANEGLAGARSGLWFEYERIIGEVRPRFVVIENVCGLVRRGLDVVLEGLWSLGYEVEGTRIRASDLGAPHRRERLFLLAHAHGERVRLEPERGQSNASKRGNAEPLDARQARRMARATERRGRKKGARKGADAREGDSLRAWAAQSDVCRVAHGVPDWLERLRSLGNAVVPPCAAIVGARVMTLAGER